MMQKPSRPAGVTILAVLEILFGIVGLLVSIAIIGLAALFSTLPRIGPLLSSFGLVIGGVAFFFSLIWLATGVGFLHGRGWAWTLGMIFSVLSLLGSVAALTEGLLTGATGGIFFWTLLLYYLTRSHVKAFFGRGSLLANPSLQMGYPPMPGMNQPPATNIPSYAQSPTETPSSAMPTLQTVGSTMPRSVPIDVSSLPTFQAGGSNAQAKCPYCKSPLSGGSPKCMTCGAII